MVDMKFPKREHWHVLALQMYARYAGQGMNQCGYDSDKNSLTELATLLE